jgi:hypothetical protein
MKVNFERDHGTDTASIFFPHERSKLPAGQGEHHRAALPGGHRPFPRRRNMMTNSTDDLSRVGVDRGHRLLRRRRWLESTVPRAGDAHDRSTEYADALARAGVTPRPGSSTTGDGGHDGPDAA